MREMMLAEKNFGRRDAEPFLDEMLNPQLVAEPGDHRIAENPMGTRKGLHARQEQSLELKKRLLEKNDVVQVGSPDGAGLEAKFDRALGEFVVVLLPGKALFLGGGNEH